MDSAVNGQSRNEENTISSSTIPERRISSSVITRPGPFKPSRGDSKLGIFARTHIGVMVKRYKGTLLDYGESGQRVHDLKSSQYPAWIDLEVFRSSPDRTQWIERIKQLLSLFHVPEDAHPSAIRELFEVLDGTVRVGQRIELDVYDLMVAPQSVPNPVENLRLFGPELSCAICVEEYPPEDGEVAIISRWPCGHHYHKDCSDKWLMKSCVCPICRFDLSLA